ncbi:hypothetical protein KR032_011418 [Drosophila birchii]|nr:hypothetical protein KR032_011418 [Drosophila birchii]
MAEETFNADELNPPEWLNLEFITEVLSGHEKAPELKVIDLTFAPASPKGDHYASIMFRAKVKYTTQKGEFFKSLIIKTMPEVEGLKKDMLAESPLFKTEIGMYSEFLPECERILREVNDDAKLYVDCIYHSLNPKQVIIFDDLVEMGYAVVRDRWLTQQEICSAYSKLAKIQAISMKMINERPDYLKDFKYGMCEMPGLMDSPIVNGGMPLFLEFLASHPELNKYLAYFEKIKLHYKDELRNTMQEYRRNPQREGYYVLCHGDYHSRNMMFKHNKETGGFEDCMLLDYQGCNITPMAVDLIYSIYMLMGSEQRAEEVEQLLNYYFSVLLETLQKIGYQGKMPTPHGFWAELKRHRYYEFLMVSTFMPVCVGLKTYKLDIEKMLYNDESRRQCYQYKEFFEDAKQMLERLERLGYFDEL